MGREGRKEGDRRCEDRWEMETQLPRPENRSSRYPKIRVCVFRAKGQVLSTFPENPA